MTTGDGIALLAFALALFAFVQNAIDQRRWRKYITKKIDGSALSKDPVNVKIQK